MASNKSDFDPGFEEVHFDPGFEETSITPPKASAEDKISAMGGDSGDAVLKSLQVSGGAKPASMEEAKAYGTGALQGGTFGLSDELGAAADLAVNNPGKALKATAGLLYGSPSSVSDVIPKWREFQKQRESANKEVQKQSPGAYLAGELSGGIASAALTPEITGGEALLGAAGKYGSKVIPGMEKFLASKTGSTAANIAGKGVANAIEGAPAGGLYGAGTSEKTVEGDPLGLASDVGTGVEYGSLGGAALGMGMEAGKSAIQSGVKTLSNIPAFAKLGEQWKLGTKHIDPYTTEGIGLQMTMANKTIPTQVAEQVLKTDSYLGAKVGEVWDNAQSLYDAGKLKLNIDPELQSSVQEISKTFADNPLLLKLLDPESKNVLLSVSKDGLGDLSPVEARALKDSFWESAAKLEGSKDPSAGLAIENARQLAKSLNKQFVEQIPGYQQANNRFNQFRTLVPETIQQPGMPVSARTDQFGDIKGLAAKKQELIDKTRSLFGGATMPGASDKDMSAVGMLELKKRLKMLEAKDPDALAQLGDGKSADEIFQDWKQKSTKMGAIYQGQGVDPHAGASVSILGSPISAGQGFAFNMANRAGSVAAHVSESPIVRMGSKVYNTSDDALMSFAQKLKGKPGTDYVGKALENALNKKDDVAKNAVLFRMMQDPYYRDLLGANDPETQQVIK